MTTISEDIFLFGVCVKIDEHLDAIVMLKDVLLDVHNLF